MSEPPRGARVSVSGARKLVVLWGALLSVLTALFSCLVIYAAAKGVVHDSLGLRAGVVITLTALGATAIWLPVGTWRAANWLARLGLRVPCPACGERVSVGRRICVCGERLRPSRDQSRRLTSRLGAQWPVGNALFGFLLSVVIAWAVAGLLQALSVHVTVLVAIALTDVTLVSVALAFASRVEPPQPWQFGLRETSLALAAKADLIAYGCLVAASAAYYLLFGPFTVNAGSTVSTGASTGLIIGAVLLAPLAEEFFFRGFVYGTLRRALSWERAAFLTTAMFVSVHWLSHYPLWALVPIAFFSVASCLVYECTGSIWPCIALHAANNASLFGNPLLGGIVMCAIVAATVAVIQRSGSDRTAAPHWLVPTAAAAACAGILALAGAFKTAQPTNTAEQAGQGTQLKVAGFPAGGGTAPATGTWTATATVTSSVGYSNEARGDTFEREWEFDRQCTPSGDCQYLMTKQTDTGTLTASLTREPDGWHAVFPPETLPCGDSAGAEITWPQQSTFVLRFSNGGTVATANERIFSYAPQCGYATAIQQWTATTLGS